MDAELNAMYAADLDEHARGYRRGTPEYAAMRERDRLRRQRVRELVAAQRLSTAADLVHAARIFQHGDEPADAKQAYELALAAVELGSAPARWMAAAALDRWQMYQGKPQRYGTQFVTDGLRHRLWDVDPATTDAERAQWDVPPLAEQLRKAEEATRIDPPGPVGDDAPRWLREAIDRWRSS